MVLFSLAIFLRSNWLCCKSVFCFPINEFVSSIKPSLEDLENTGRRGYIEGISNIIIKNNLYLQYMINPFYKTKQMKIAFIGLGIMGSNMASNLAKNNLNLTVYNRTPKKLETSGNSNVFYADSIQNAVKDADIVFSMLSTPQVVEEVFFENPIFLDII